MNGKFLVTLALACIAVALAPSWGQDAPRAAVVTAQRG